MGSARRETESTVLTRCPACETHFRVTAEQLKARSGRVRCGKCQHVFSALDSLIEDPAPVFAPLPPEPAARELPFPLSGIEADAPDHPQARTDEVAFPPAPTPAPAEEEPTQTVALHSAAQEPSIEENAETVAAVEIAGTVAAAEPDTAEPAALPEVDVPGWSETFPEPAPPRRWPWAIGSLLAFAAIGLQAALAFRIELATLWPEARPALVALCDIADCQVGLPAKVGLVGIEASDLHPDPERAGHLALSATLKNRAPFAQAFPHLELTLTDTADKAIARKVLAPADYLPPKASLTNGMPPNADVVVAVGIDAGEMAASGYRLYLFYP
jgi:predicted Zn finger-like uncharacterized protein